MSLRFRTSLFLALFAVLATLCLAADKDTAGAKDHPLVSRMPGFFINGYQDLQYDQLVFKVGNPPKITEVKVEGHVYKIHYGPGREMAATSKPSALQVIRNYQNALKSIGGEVLGEDSWNGNAVRGTTLRIHKDDKIVWIFVKAYPSDYNVEIVEQQVMKQDVVAGSVEWKNEIEQNGKATVGGIFFDTAKSVLKPESDASIAEVAKMLKDNPKLKVYVVGHTDNVGDTAANLKLSQARAQSVTTALVSKHGIAASRLLPFGAGPYAPVASNRNEEGRAKNRRVELVEIAAGE